MLVKTHEVKQLQVMSLSKRSLVRKEGFEGKLALISFYKISIYLSLKIESIEVSILIDIKTTNSFMSPTSTKKLKLIQ